MRNFIKPRVALWMVFFFVFNLIGCGGGGGGGGSDTSAEARLQEALTSFNLSAEWVVDDLVDLKATVDQLNEKLAADDGSTKKADEIGTLADQFGHDADSFLASVQTMDLAESEIQGVIGSEDGVTSLLLTTIVGTGLVIYGLYSFGKKMKNMSDEAIEEHKKVGTAYINVSNGVPGAEEAFNAAKKRRMDIGAEATSEFTTKLISDLALSPFNPSSLTGVLIKHKAGNKLQKVLKVVSATEECEDGYDSPGCKIGVDETDESGNAVVPEGKATIVIASEDMARIVVEEEITPGSFKEITIDPVSIKNAGDDLIGNDDNVVPGDDTNTDPEDEDDDTPVDPVMTLSSKVSKDGADFVTYTVTAEVSGIIDTTKVTISVTNAAVSNAVKTMSADGTVSWSVTVQDKDASVKVVRSDTGEQQSLTLSGKTFDGTYSGVIVVTENSYDACAGGEFEVDVSGSSISGGEGVMTGTLTGSQVSMETEWWIFSGSITNNVMSGTWYDKEDWCNGTFSATKH